MKKLVCMCVVALLLGASSSLLWADSVNLPPNVLLQMKFINWDVGTIYGGYADGTYTEAQLHATPPGGTTQTRPPSSNSGEDSWGVFRLREIDDPLGNPVYATSATSEITGIFWGGHDWQMSQTGGVQTIYDRGINFAFYLDNTPDFNRGDPTTDRTKDGSVYLPFFNTATDGTLIWTGHSVPGFIAPGGVVDPLNEFVTVFNPTTKDVNNGGFYGDLSPVTYKDGLGVTHTLTGQDNGQWSLWKPGNPAFPANFQFQFTGLDATIGDPTSKWLVRSNDPITGISSTPELSTCALLLLGFVPIGMGRMRLRRKKA